MSDKKRPPRNASRGLSSEEMDAWRQIAEQLTPIKAKPRREEVLAPPVKKPRGHYGKQEMAPPELLGKQTHILKPGMDHNMLTRLKEGKQRPEGRIDLHGMTEDQAYTHLKSSIALAYEEEARLVLVITGKGRGGEGLLKRRVPLWLEEDCGGAVTGYAPALQKDGGAGALYVTLRRKDK